MIVPTRWNAPALLISAGAFVRARVARDAPRLRQPAPMTSEEFRDIEKTLATGHADMAAQLGISEVSVKRYATGSQPVPEPVARLMVALVVMSQNRPLQRRFQELLATYQADT